EVGPLAGIERVEAPLPGVAQLARALPGGAPGVADVGRYLEGRRRPAELLAGALDLVGAERRAVAFLGAGLGRGAEADRGLAGDHARPVGGVRGPDRARDRLRIVAVDTGRGPAGRLEALDLVDRVGERQWAVDRDAVVVEQPDQPRQLEGAG